MKPIKIFLSQIANTTHTNPLQLTCHKMDDAKLVAAFNKAATNRSLEFGVLAKELFNRKYSEFISDGNSLPLVADMLAILFNSFMQGEQHECHR